MVLSALREPRSQRDAVSALLQRVVDLFLDQRDDLIGLLAQLSVVPGCSLAQLRRVVRRLPGATTPRYSRRMHARVPSDLDIARSAHQWIALHRENATAKAREMVEAMRKKGDKDGADTWLRIIVAITTLGEPPSEARH